MDLDALMARYSEGVTEAQKREAMQQALAAAGFAMLGANTGGGWQGAARALGRGGLLGMGAYNQALGDAAQAPLQQLDVYSKFAQMKAQEQRARESEEAKRSSADFSQQLSGVFGAGPQLGNMGPGGPTPANAQRVAPPSQIEKYRQAAAMYAARGDTEGAKRLADIADSMEGVYSTNPQIGMGPGGAQFAQFSNKGGMRTVEGFAPPPDMQILNLGGKQVAIDKRATAPGAEFGVTMDPAQKDASARGWADINDRRAREAAALADAASARASGAPEKPLTESQATAALYYGMMKSASDDISNLDPKNLSMARISAARGGVPYVPDAVLSSIAGPDAQKYNQSALQWTEAMLRATTGATAPPDEVKRTAKTFFPQVGDSRETIKQKDARRADMERLMAIKAGGGSALVESALTKPAPKAIKWDQLK